MPGTDISRLRSPPKNDDAVTLISELDGKYICKQERKIMFQTANFMKHSSECFISWTTQSHTYIYMTDLVNVFKDIVGCTRRL